MCVHEEIRTQTYTEGDSSMLKRGLSRNQSIVPTPLAGIYEKINASGLILPVVVLC